MILGYLIFEAILYGFGASVVNIPMNALQGAFGLVLGILLTKIFEKHKIFLYKEDFDKFESAFKEALDFMRAQLNEEPTEEKEAE